MNTAPCQSLIVPPGTCTLSPSASISFDFGRGARACDRVPAQRAASVAATYRSHAATVCG